MHFIHAWVYWNFIQLESGTSLGETNYTIMHVNFTWYMTILYPMSLILSCRSNYACMHACSTFPKSSLLQVNHYTELACRGRHLAEWPSANDI